MSSTTSGYSNPLEIDVGESVIAATFAANGEYLVCLSNQGVGVWRVKDGERVTMMTMDGYTGFCVAASKDGEWIAAGSSNRVLVWNATTYERVLTQSTSGQSVYDIDFSPDSSRLVSADGYNGSNCTATVIDLTTRRTLRTLSHGRHGYVYQAKYSPRGDRIATALANTAIRVWSSENGQLLVDINVTINTYQNRLSWFNDHLFVASSDNKIKEIDSATGSIVSEWPISFVTCIALPQHGRFLACGASNTITFWDTSTRSQLCLIPCQNPIFVAFSPDARLLATPGDDNKIFIRIKLSVTVSEIYLGSAALDAWEHGQLANAEALLTAEIPTSQDTAHVLAGRALVRAHLPGQWDAALADANESIKTRRSVFGYIAKCVALVGKGEVDRACRMCDMASQHFYSEDGILLLIKAVVLFMAGKHDDAVARLDDLITDGFSQPTFHVVQAYMHLLLGDLHMGRSHYEHAIHSFEDAFVKLGDRVHRPPLAITLLSGWKFDGLAFTIQRRLCEALWAAGRSREAGECVLRMADQEANTTEPANTWVSDFKCRCRNKLEELGDDAMNAKQYEKAIPLYTTALSLNPGTPQDLLVRRSKARTGKGLWKDALEDANEIIELDPSSPLGYERKHHALRGAGDFSDAVEAFETMLLKMSESPDRETRDRSRRYVRPEQTQETIRTAIKKVIRDSPLVLIDVNSGRLCDKSEQATAFESTPAFTELICSMTTHIDNTLIEREVGEFYRYATLSHTWQPNEPLYEHVIKIVVYDLAASPTHDKLRMFCTIVRGEGFNWAWSDTCCVNKVNPIVLQETLASMFKWYEGSAMTIIFLFDVDGLVGPGALVMSTWNSRAWALQEYHASKVARFYNKDWTPYLGLTIYNHKEAPEVISEMEKAIGISAPALLAIRPGLSDIREKLCLASTRRTTEIEDAAYSLLGIFSMTLSIAYGEEDKALGRLLSQLLTSSGDTSILAWTGTSNAFNSCLPTKIAVFSQPLITHIPPAVTDAEMKMATEELRTSSLDLTLATRLHGELDRLPTPFFVGQRMKLPCLAFKLRNISGLWKGSELVFRAQAAALGTVEIKTRLNLTKLGSLYLVHPWIDFLLDRRAGGGRVEFALEEHEVSELDEFPSVDSFPELSGTESDVEAPDDTSLPSPPYAETHVYKFLARLRQPFGALLLIASKRNAEYKRIVAECLITAQVEEVTSATLDALIQSVRMLDVL